MKDRRIGKVSIRRTMITEAPVEVLRRFFSLFIPVHTEYDFASDSFTYTVLNRNLSPVPTGLIAPWLELCEHYEHNDLAWIGVALSRGIVR